MRPQPPSNKAPGEYDDEGRKIKKKTKRGGRKGTVKEKLLKGNPPYLFSTALIMCLF